MRKIILMMLLVVLNSIAMAADDKNVASITRLSQHLNAQGSIWYYEPASFLAPDSTSIYNTVQIGDVSIETCRIHYKETNDSKYFPSKREHRVVVDHEFDIADIQKVSVDEHEEFEDEELSRKRFISTVKIEFPYEAVTKTWHYENSDNENIVPRLLLKNVSIHMPSREAAKRMTDLFVIAEQYCKKFVK